MRVDINAGTIALQAAIKENVELTRVVEDNFAWEGQCSGEQDLVNCCANLIVLSADNGELMEHWQSLQISLNRDQTGNIMQGGC